MIGMNPVCRKWQVDVQGLGAVEQLMLEYLEEIQQMLQQKVQELRWPFWVGW